MLISPAFAQGAGAPSGRGFEMFLPFILIIVIFYFLLWRPQQKKMNNNGSGRGRDRAGLGPAFPPRAPEFERLRLSARHSMP